MFFSISESGNPTRSLYTVEDEETHLCPTQVAGLNSYDLANLFFFQFMNLESHEMVITVEAEEIHSCHNVPYVGIPRLCQSEACCSDTWYGVAVSSRGILLVCTVMKLVN